MKKILFILALGCVMLGCRSKIDIENMDNRAQVEAGVALPIGSFHITLEDMLGDVEDIYVDTVNTKNIGVITWKMDTSIGRDYHKLDLAKYITKRHVNMKVYDKLVGQPFFLDGKISTGTEPQQVRLDFDMPITLHGINNPDSLGSERLDSAIIENARFASFISRTGDLPLEWKWIDSVTLDLGDKISRPAGNVMKVYDRSMTGVDYGDSIPTDIDKFNLVLMKNRNLNPKNPLDVLLYPTNVDSLCNFIAHFYFTIPKDTILPVPKDAGFDYLLRVQFITYKAIWGMFDPSGDMQAEEIVDMSSSWGKLDFLTKAALPFSEPVVTANVKTEIAGMLYIDSAYVFVADKNKKRAYAEFGPTRNRYRQVLFREDQCLSITSEIGDTTKNMTIRFDSTEEGGRLHELFERIPRELGYRFMVRFNAGITPQIRITPNTKINVRSHSKLPFIFNEGVWVNYPDTTRDVDLSKVSLDSLTKESDVLDTLHATNLRLVLNARNTIPLHVKAAMRCYDDKDNMIMDPKDPKKPFILFETDTITLDPPAYAKNVNGTWVPTSDGITTIISTLEKDEIETLATVKTITYSVMLDDKALKYAYDKGMTNIRLTKDQGVTFKVGLAANVNAILNFNNDKNK